MDQNMDNPNPTNEGQPQQSEAQVPPQPEPAPPTIDASAITQDSKTMAMLCHLLGLFTNFIGPLILWLIKKDEDKFVDSQGKEALNFQITIAIAGVAATILMPVFCIGALIGIAAAICNVIFCILACVAANKGEDYRYPVCIRLIK
jgi:uncharacterized Tic20 family protein